MADNELKLTECTNNTKNQETEVIMTMFDGQTGLKVEFGDHPKKHNDIKIANYIDPSS